MHPSNPSLSPSPPLHYARPSPRLSLFTPICLFLFLLVCFCPLLFAQTPPTCDVLFEPYLSDPTGVTYGPLSVEYDQFTYFAYQPDITCTTASPCTVIVIVKKIENDADLYAQLLETDGQPLTTFPCADFTAPFYSESPGGDALIIPGVTSDQTVLIYTTAGTTSTATYDIIADYTTPSRFRNVTRLNPGDSLYGVVTAVDPSSYWSRYDVLTPSAGTLTLTLRRIQGNTQLYAANSRTPYLNVSDATTAGTVDDSVTMVVDGSLHVFVGVYAQELSSFLIWASFVEATAGPPTGNQTQRLTAGVPFPGQLTGAQDEAVYFYFPSTTDFTSPITIFLDVTSIDGEADMYVSWSKLYDNGTVEGQPFPSQADSRWAAVDYQDDVLIISAEQLCSTPCNYSIAVVPWMNKRATFTLTITKTTPRLLSDGVLTTDQVAEDFIRYYYFLPPTTISSLTITVQQTAGSVYLYLSNSTQPNPDTPSSYNAWDTGLGDLTITATPSAPWFCGSPSCHYRIAVVGQYPPPGATVVSYSIRVSTSAVGSNTSTSGGLTLLTNSLQANTFTGTEGSTRYFYLQLVQSTVPRTMSITLTSLTGDADLYYKFSTTSTALHPNETFCDGSSLSSSAVDLVAITPALPGYYFIAVNAWTNSTYRLLASIYNQTVLTDGYPQSGVVAQDQFNYYNFTLAQFTPRMTVSLFKVSGEPDLYLRYADYPTRGEYDNASLTLQTDVVTVDEPQLGVWVVGVYGFDMSVYTLLVSTQNSSSVLSVGKSVTGNITRGYSDFYAVKVDAADRALTVTLTVLAGNGGQTGDCDLFMSSVEQRPSVDNFDFSRGDVRADDLGSDSITLSSQALRQVGVPATWYIGVSAFQSCLYSIVATFNGTVTLQDGKPQGGAVAKGAYNFYNVTVLDSVNYTLTISASATRGSVQLFIVSSSTSTPLPPSLSDNDWMSQEYRSDPSLTLTATDPKFCQTLPCYYSIAVLGTSTDAEGVSTYSISANIRSSSTLQDGVSALGTIAPLSSAYYQFYNFYAESAILITATATSAGSDPDLYVSTNVSRPSAQSYAKRGTLSGKDVIFIDSSDSFYTVGAYYIAVYCAAPANLSLAAPCSYSLLARAYNLSGTSTAILLAKNVELTGYVTQRPTSNHSLTQFYRYDVQVNRNATTGASTEDVVFTLTSQYGDPDMYIGQGFYPSPSNATLAAVSTGGGVIIIRAADVCRPNCTYYIAVTAYAGISSLYSIRVTTGPQTVVLRAGYPETRSVDALTGVLFALDVDHSDALAIVATSISGGDPDIYVSFGDSQAPPPVVNTTQYQYRSIDYGTDVLSISQTQVGTYYIFVYGYSATSFTLLATLGATNLWPGVPQHDYLHTSDYRLYVFSYPDLQPALPLSFSVVPTGGFRTVNMYASTTAYPTPESWMWSSVYLQTEYTNNLTIPVCSAEEDSNLCVTVSTKYYLRLEAVGNTQMDVTAFYGDIPSVLSAGRPLRDNVGYEQCKTYRAYLSNSTVAAGGVVADASIDVTEAYGDVTLYVSFSNPQPSQADYDYTTPADSATRSTHLGLDVSALPSGVRPNSGNVIPVYIAVCGAAQTGSSYSILFSTLSILLPLGQPQSAVTRAGGGVYFFVQSQVAAPGVNASITISISGVAADGSTDFTNTTQYTLYGCNDQLSECQGVYQPNVYQSVFNTSLINGQEYTLPLPPTGLNTGTYFLGLFASTSVPFIITARQRTMNASTTLTQDQLLAGEFVTSRLDPEYYEARLPPPQHARITIDVCSGSGQLVVSSVNQYPAAGLDASSVFTLAPSRTTPIPYQPSLFSGQVYMAVLPTVEGSTLRYDIRVTNQSTTSSTSSRYFTFTPNLRVTGAAGGFDLTWDRAVPILPSTPLRYLVYWTLVDDDVNVFTACGCSLVQASSTSGWMPVAQPTSSSIFSSGVSASVRGLPTNTYKVNVVAGVGPSSILNLFSNSITASVAGDGVTIYTSGSSSDSSGYSSSTIAAVTVPIVLIVVFAFCYLCWRNAKLQAELTGVEMMDVPRQQVVKAIRGAGFRRRAEQRLARPGRSKYGMLMGHGMEGGTEMSISELGLDDEGEGEEDGNLYTEGEDGDERRVYTLDAVLEDMGAEEDREDSLGFST